jgi:hypothetical protein
MPRESIVGTQLDDEDRDVAGEHLRFVQITGKSYRLRQRTTAADD